jgi:hypothetical protein
VTPKASPPLGVDRLTLTIHGTDTSVDMLSTVGELYAEIYAEPPYDEGPAEVEHFTSGWSQQIDQTNFRLVVARRADEPIGFAFGYQLAHRLAVTGSLADARLAGHGAAVPVGSGRARAGLP